MIRQVENQQNTNTNKHNRTPFSRASFDNRTPVADRTPVRSSTVIPQTPQRLNHLERKTYGGVVTTPIDRASESLEKINEVFR